MPSLFTGGSTGPTPLPSATSPSTGSPENLTTTAAPTTARPIGMLTAFYPKPYTMLADSLYTFSLLIQFRSEIMRTQFLDENDRCDLCKKTRVSRAFDG